MADDYEQEKMFCNGDCRDLAYFDITGEHPVCIVCGYVSVAA